MKDNLLFPSTKLSSRISIFGGVVAGAIAVIVGTVAVVSSFAGNEQLYLSPASGNVLAGNTIAVQIRVNSATDPVNAVQANLTFDPAKLAYQSVDATGSAFSLAASSTVAGGSISLARAIGGGEAAVTGDNLFATVTFKALVGAGTAAVSIATGSHVVRSTDNVDLLTSSAGATYTLISPVNPTPTPAPTATPTSVPTTSPTPVSTPVPTVAPTSTPGATPSPTPALATASGSLFISPPSPSVTTGTNVTLQIFENSGTSAVNAVESDLTFDPAKLQYVSVDDTGSAFGLVAVTSAGNGILQLARATSPGTPAVSGNNLVTKVTFKAIAASGAATVGFGTGSHLIRSAGSADILSQTTPAIVQIQAVTPAGGGVTPAPVPTAAPPAVLTPVVGAKKPTVVQGTVKLTTPAISSNNSVTYSVDGNAVDSNVVDSTKLDNGAHIVTATTTDNRGKVEEVKQKINVNNKVPLWKSLIAGVKTNFLTLGLVLIVIILLVGGLLAMRKVMDTQQLVTPQGVQPNLVLPNNSNSDDSQPTNP